MADPRVQYVASEDGVRIAYTAVGQGDPFVFAANVWGDIELAFQKPSPIYGELVDSLVRNNCRVVVYDGRGCGASDRGLADMSWAARLSDLEAVADRLELEQFALFTVAHGCTTAIGYAARHPEKVTHLILESAYANGEDYYARGPALRAIKALSDLAEDNWEFFTLTLTNWLTNFKSAEAAAELAATYRRSMEGGDYRRLVAGFERTDVTDLLGLVRAPTLVVQDAASPFSLFSQFASLREVVAGIDGAELRHVKNREEMVTAIVQFIRGESDAITASESDRSRPFRAVLFTDLVGHTEMMSRLGDDRGRDVLREHERITREVLKANGGTEVKTMGDGFMASFGSVARAVECAIGLQKAFEEWNVGAQRLPEATSGKDVGGGVATPLQVRVGLNAGEPIEEDGDLFGATVILASRIAAKAGGGEILVADTVRGLCSGKGFLFGDRGEFLAKGFEEPVRVYEVNWRR